ncbi:MAG: ligase-associated DNA damage response endonuclease PdeM [Beijerinckiaceae bacterium]|nr:ligase-associated DNA damage response endonuclease PdeM [Beijerinckiaceae bacterium]
MPGNKAAQQRPRDSRFNPAFAICNVSVVPDISGALYLPDTRTLVVADLHFEKGSALAARGHLLPPYDTAATLAQLSVVIAAYAPVRVIALGDSFHDARAGERLAANDRSALCGLMAGREWVWILGNHDPEIPAGLGETCAMLEHGGLVFRHEPCNGASPAEVAGHLHPAARVVSPYGSVRRKCFVSDGRRCILPAFGAYTGGLNFRSQAFAGLFAAADIIAHVLGSDRIYAIPESRCIGG